MKSIHEFLAEAKAAPAKKVAPVKKATPVKKSAPVKKPSKDTTSSSRIKCVQAVVENLKKVLGDYDIATRKYVWNKLVSVRGEELMSQIVRYPKTSMSMSEFNKLVIDSKK